METVPSQIQNPNRTKKIARDRFYQKLRKAIGFQFKTENPKFLDENWVTGGLCLTC
jgi:hypothetical protein